MTTLVMPFLSPPRLPYLFFYLIFPAFSVFLSCLRRAKSPADQASFAPPVITFVQASFEKGKTLYNP